MKENFDCLAAATTQETPLMVDARPAGDAVMVEQYVGLICPVDPREVAIKSVKQQSREQCGGEHRA